MGVVDGAGAGDIFFSIRNYHKRLRQPRHLIMSRALAVKYLKGLSLHDDAKLISKTTTKSNLKSQLQITRMVCKQMVARKQWAIRAILGPLRIR